MGRQTSIDANICSDKCVDLFAGNLNDMKEMNNSEELERLPIMGC